LTNSRTSASARPDERHLRSQTTTVRIGITRNTGIVSCGVTEIDHVAVVHDVLLAFETQLTVLAAGGE
jgi:hypothetical protein